jgi:hypothetical protein
LAPPVQPAATRGRRIVPFQGLDAQTGRPVQKTLDAVPHIVGRIPDIFRVNKLAISIAADSLFTA